MSRALLLACASVLPEKQHGDCRWNCAVPSITSSPFMGQSSACTEFSFTQATFA